MISRDLLWKGIIEDLFDDFLWFFFPALAAMTDYEKGFEFLDKELAQLFSEADNHARIADKLVKVFLKDGTEQWVLVHVEVQGYEEAAFAHRMFVYYYRIYDRYQKPIVALAMLTDENPKFRPQAYEFKLHGTSIRYEFNLYKLLDANMEHLEAQDNPFAVIIRTAWYALSAKRLQDEQIFTLKTQLLRAFIYKGISKTKIGHLLNFLRYYIRFTKEQSNLLFEEQIDNTTQTKKSMGTDEIIRAEFQRIGIEEGRKKGIEEGRQEGRQEGVNLSVLRLLKKGFSSQQVSEMLEVPLEQVLQAQQEQNNIEQE